MNAEHLALAARLSRMSVDKHTDAYADIAWDSPDHAIDAADPRWELGADDPIGASDWYRGLPAERRARLGLHVVAARTDARLRRTVAGITRRFTGSVYQSFRELFPDSRAQGDTAPAFAFAVLQGLALDRIAMPDAPHIGHVIDRLKLLGSIVVPEGPR